MILKPSLLLFAVVIAPHLGHAQGSKRPKSEPKATSEKASTITAYLRVWKSDLPGTGPINVTLQGLSNPPGKRKDGQKVATVGVGYQFASYVEVPVGLYVVEAAAVGQEAHPFASVPANLLAGSFTTVLVNGIAAVGGTPAMELFSDGTAEKSTDAQGALRARFSVRNLTPELHNLHINVGEVLSAQFAPVEGGLRFNGIPPGVYSIRTTGTDAKGEVFEWKDEGNFERFHRQTLLIYPDPYGRIRPRLIVDGVEALADNAPSDDRH